MEYKDREQEWLARNKVSVGSMVKIIRIATSFEDGWANSWLSYMDKALGQEGMVEGVRDDSWGIEIDVKAIGIWSYPYFVLEVPIQPGELKLPRYDEE